jgi:hypothetical protein
MRAPLLVAVLLVVGIAVAHSYLGERYILIRLIRREILPKLFGGTEFTKNTLRFAWHVTSVAWLGFAGVLIALASGTEPVGGTVARVVAATFALSGALALFGSRGRHPSWIVFFAIAVFVWLAEE